jgi:hypothetical protein
VIRSRFPNPASALALFHKTEKASCRRSSGLIPPQEPCPSMPPEGLVQVGTQLLSWVFGLSRFSLESAQEKVVSPFSFPFHSSKPEASQPPTVVNPRVSGAASLGVSPCGAPTCSAFLAVCIRHLFNKITCRGLFFHLEAPCTLASTQPLLFTADVLFPNGRW